MSEPMTAADLFPSVVARLGGDGRAREHQVFTCFEEVISGPLKGRVRADALRGTTLFVLVSSSALAHEVTLLKRFILERLGEKLGPGLVEDLRTRVG